MNRSTILAIGIALLIAAPIGLASAEVVPEEFKITEERCLITVFPQHISMTLMYRFQVEDYHYESRYGLHYGYDPISGDFGWVIGPYDEKVHDGWHDEESQLANVYRNMTRNRWIREERCFIRIGDVDSPEFDIEANHIYTMTVDGVDISIDNSLTEVVTHQVPTLLIGVLVGLLFFGLSTVVLSSCVEGDDKRREKRKQYLEGKRQRELMEREMGRGYREY